MLYIFILLTVLVQDAAAPNPLDQLRDEVKRLLAESGVPFTEEQEKAIALMTEDRRQAAEELFGDMLDFRGGPVEGEQMDRAAAAIQWIQGEFSQRLREHLTPEQKPVWERFESGGALKRVLDSFAPGARPAEQKTQLIRINNNRFTAEGAGYGDNNGTEVIERGGIGSYHGNFSLELKDEALNARNPFAHNKPPYQEQQFNANVSGPVIRNLLTTNLSLERSREENVSTVHAITPSGPFDLGIVRPRIAWNANVRNIYQLTERHSLRFNLRYNLNSQQNLGVGDFTLPERASRNNNKDWNFEVRQFSALSPYTLYETRFNFNRSRFQTTPDRIGFAVNVLDAFRGGGSTDRSDQRNGNYEFGNLFTRMGETHTVKAGIEGAHRTNYSLSESNFNGQFTFSDLNAFLEERPLTYRVYQGNPLLMQRQTEVSFFSQHDVKVTQRLTLMLGARYAFQSNLADRNNFAPRLGFAYAIRRNTVIRGGVGVYYQFLDDDVDQTQKRLDGTRQVEVVISAPSFPNPFQSGSVAVTAPSSIRVTDRTLAAPYNAITSLMLEQTFQNNLFVSVTYDMNRGVRQYRSRNLNAPLPGQTIRPDPERGNILNLESTGMSRQQTARFSLRKRFSIFNGSFNYSLHRGRSDSDGANSLPSDNYNLRADWSRTNTQTHQAGTTINAQLPLGVFLAGTMSYNSGNKYNITTGRDDNGDQNTNDRPAGVPRNSGNGPKFLSFNFNISKAVFFGQRDARGTSGLNLNMFANMTNAFNRTNHGTPSGVMTSPFFGRSFNARAPREIQAGLRFQF